MQLKSKMSQFGDNISMGGTYPLLQIEGSTTRKADASR
jgi:hypothetical protein